MTHHHLRTWPRYFQAILDGRKNFEIRVNDRGFAEGDSLCLEEWSPETQRYSGRIAEFTIGFVVESEWGLEQGICAFALLPCERS